jgi:glycosyltransferase involved in cell wall biosynthesis
MRIGILGTRGIPAHHGGFETCVEQTALRLAARGHDVTVYCRREPGEQPAGYQGVRLIYRRQPDQKYLHTLGHTFVCALHALGQRYDVVHLYSVGNSTLVPLLRLGGQRVAVSVDALDWNRAKWGRFARWYLKTSERFAVWFGERVIVDSRVIEDYYRAQYRARTAYIAYGGEVERPQGTDALERLGLRPYEYVVFVGRLKPEKQVHHLIEAYAGLEHALPLVIVGDDPFAKDYIARLHALAAPVNAAHPERVRFVGTVYGDGFKQLCANAYLYVTPSAVEGTSPALLGAMGMGAAVLVNGIPENRETIGDAGYAYPANDVAGLRAALAGLFAQPERVRQMGACARERVATVYSWDHITDELEQLYGEMMGRRTREAERRA